MQELVLDLDFIMCDTIYYLIIVIYYFYVKKRYFRFRWFISLFLGVFNAF